MRASQLFTTLSLLSTFAFASASASLPAPSLGTSPVPIPANTTAVSPHPDHHLDKRTLCILGLCIGGSSYDSDVNNCGSRGNKCSTSWPNGGGAVCSAGVCGPSYCNNLFDFNWLTGNCQNVGYDSNNWYAHTPCSLSSPNLTLTCVSQLAAVNAVKCARSRTLLRRLASVDSATHVRVSPFCLSFDSCETHLTLFRSLTRRILQLWLHAIVWHVYEDRRHDF